MSATKGKAPAASTVEASVKTTPAIKQKELSMSNSTEVSAIRAIAVPFHGVSLRVVDQDGQPYVPMRPIVEGMGLTWPSQYRKLAANKARWGITVMVTPLQQGVSIMETPAGGLQQMLAMPLRKLPGWLANLEPIRIKSLEVRARVIQYQNECDDVLWKYWNEGAAFNPRAITRITPTQAQHLKELVQIVAESGKQTHGETWNRLHRKMKVNSYLELPASRFDEACNYLRGKMDDTSMATLIQKHFPGSALMVAAPAPDADHVASTFMAAQSIGAQVQSAAFKAMLAGGDDWKHQHWEISFITDSREAIPAIVQKLGADEFTTSMRRLTRDISKPGSTKFSSAELAHLNAACSMSLSERMEHQAETRMLAA